MKDKRQKEIVIARQVAMYFSKDFFNNSLKSWDFILRERSWYVIHAVQSVNDMIDTDNFFFKKSISKLIKEF